MQNWNQWQLPAGPVSTPMPQLPMGYATPGADPMATMQAYMQYYNQPAPSGYTAEQWATAQQQNWAQWQTWQQQYQQWQAQYGEKYQETLKQISSQAIPSAAPVPAVVQPPPLPKEDTSAKPPLPPENNSYGYSGVPPPHQNNLPLFPSRQSVNANLPASQPPLPPDNSRDSTVDNNQSSGKRTATSSVEAISAKKSKIEDEELTEAEKTFDAQFKQWEEQFNKWKQQNANHPDKTQYKQYEAKWTSWREKLIERREQMRRKREQQKQTAAKADSEKDKSVVGDDKIMNLLTSTENQGLINNLLGIGKTLGLTGKNDVPGPPASQSSIQPTIPPAMPHNTTIPPAMTASLNQTAWAAQQWASQYNAGMNMPYQNYQAPNAQPSTNNPQSSMPMPNFNAPPSNFNQTPSNFNQTPQNFDQRQANFNLPPPNMLDTSGNFDNPPPNMSSNRPNFSQPPPGFGGPGSQNLDDSNNRPFRSDGDLRQGPSSGRDSMASGNNAFGFDGNRFSGPPPNNDSGMNRARQFGPNESLGRDGPKKDFAGNQFDTGNDNTNREDAGKNFGSGNRSGNEFWPNDRFGNDNDRFSSGSNRYQGNNNSNYDNNAQNQRGDNRSAPDNERFNSDRFGSNADRFGPNNDPIGDNDRFGSNDRFGPNNDRFNVNNDRFGSNNNRFGPNNDRFGPMGDRNDSNVGGRFGSFGDRSNTNNFGQSNDTFGRPSSESFDSRDNANRFGKNQFNPAPDMPPELQKLMEKRKAAIDVFKPSSFSSLLDSDKFSSSSTSLSESFKRLTGNSPFLSRTSSELAKKDNNSGPRDTTPLGSIGSGNFEPLRDARSNDGNSTKFGNSGDFRSSGPNDFRPRGPGDFGPPRGNEFRPSEAGPFGARNNEFGKREGGNFGPRNSEFGPWQSEAFVPRGNEFGPRGPGGFSGGPPMSGDLRSRMDNESGSKTRDDPDPSTQNEQLRERDGNLQSSDKKAPTTDISEPPATKSAQPDSQEKHEVDVKTGDSKPQDTTEQEVSTLETPPWMTASFADDDIIEIPITKPTDKTAATFANSPHNTPKPRPTSETPRPDKMNSENTMGNAEKKSEALPFMGENDPKPEDLNMEPPPELPNLGPMIETFDPSRESRDSPFDSPGMQKKPRSTTPGDSNENQSAQFGLTNKDENPQERASSSSGPFNPHRPNSDSLAGPRGPQQDAFNSRGQFGPFGPLGPRGPGDFGRQGPDNFGPRGPFPFGPQGPGDFGPRGPPGFGPRGPSNFGPRGLSDFGPRGPSDFDSRGPADFGPRGPSNFGPCGPPEFGPRGPSDFGPRGPSDFGPCGPPNFGPRGPSDFGPRGPSDFGPRGPSEFGPCGPSDFGPRGPADFGPQGPGDFGPGGPNDRPFAPFGMGPRDSLDRTSGLNNMQDRPFGPGPASGPTSESNSFPPRGNQDNVGSGIPSLMAFKFNRPMGSSSEMPDLPPAFGGGNEDRRPFGPNEPSQDSADQGPRRNTLGPNGPGSDWRQSFDRNEFGDSDQRSGTSNVSNTERGKQSQKNPSDVSGEQKTKQSFPHKDTAEGNVKLHQNTKSMGGSRLDESSRPLNEMNPTSESNFMTRRPHDRGGNNGPKDFCIEKQFNYNHGGGAPDEVTTDHSAQKVIEYGHASRVVDQDYMTPAQCFDYDHGSLKPVVPEHNICPTKDFRNWVESDQNLREYMDRVKSYEMDVKALHREQFKPEPISQSRDRNVNRDDKQTHEHAFDSSRNDRSRRDRDSDDYRARERRRESRERGRMERDREWDRNSHKHRDERSQHRRSRSKDGTRDRPEKIRKDSVNENNKDDERSKGNVAVKESSAKKPAEPAAPNDSEQEKKNGQPADVPLPFVEITKSQEVPKSMEVPTTMDTLKTPNFTMVDDLLCQPGRKNRPPKIVVILRGPPGSGKSFVAKLIKDKEVEQGGSAPRILSLDDYFLTEKEIETEDDNGKKITNKEMVYEYEEAMEPSYLTSLIKAFKKNITDGFFNFIILDCINEKISDYEEMWSFAKTKGFRVYVCEMEMDVQICLKRNVHNRTEEEVNRIVDYFEPTPSHHQKLDVTSMLQEEAIQEVHMEDSQEVEDKTTLGNEDTQDSYEDPQDTEGVSKWERMEAEDKLDRLDGLARRKHEGKPQTMEDFLQVPDYYNMEDTSGKRRVRWADLEERKEQEKMRAVGFVVGQTNWDRMMDPTKGGSALTRTKYI